MLLKIVIAYSLLQLSTTQTNNQNTNPNFRETNSFYNYRQPLDRYDPRNPNYIFSDQNYQQNYYNNYNYDHSYYGDYNPELLRCPRHWVQYRFSCYRFIKSPLKPYIEASNLCKTYSPQLGYSDLVSVNDPDEHGFIIHTLNWLDPQRRRWYIGAREDYPNEFINPDKSSMINMENAFFREIDTYGKNYVVYNFSKAEMHWGFSRVRGDEPLLFICEAPIESLQRLLDDDRNYTYGIEVTDPERIPRGPYFIKQPSEAIFDTSRRKMYNDVSLSCLAGGFPAPTYKWYKEHYEQDRLKASEIDPLQDGRYTLSGGLLIINRPDQNRDRTTYHCKATNKYGTIISESVRLDFGYIFEFVLKRSNEYGDMNWGKVLYCDPPNHFPSVKYYWSRDYFPNFVEEDKRVFVSNDGSLYFSALETIDRGNYSCSVQAEFSDTGRNGPFFSLGVNPHSDYQQLKFPNNFPKAFPDAPNVGSDVRLECMAFGYPIPSYNWTRREGSLPRGSFFMSFNRVLIIPKVQVEDEGEYVCRVQNDRSSLENSVVLNVQAEPNFTIPLTDKHIDDRGELVWTCEAFGIPDVNYTWWRNGVPLVMGYLDNEDRGRIKIQDNVLTISPVDKERDPGMYQCQAANALAKKYSSAQLRVLAFKPSFKKHPLESEIYAAERGNVTIFCRPEAAPKPRIIWKKDGMVIDTGGHRTISEHGNLFITQISRNDEGIYTCTAQNDFGIDESRGRLIVLRPPRLVERVFPTKPIAAQSTFSLYCAAETEQMLDIAYIWTRNGIRIRDIDVKNSYNRIRMDGGYLSISNATYADAGEYECIVRSAVGKISHKSQIIVHGPPGPPGGVTVINIIRRSVILQWTDGASHGSDILHYTISGRTNFNNTWFNISHGVYAKYIDRYTGRKEATIENVLVPWSTYEFRVAAVNELGLGVPSSPSPRHSTPPDRPYIYPYNIGGGGGKIGDLSITWTPLKQDEQNGPGIYYKVFYKRKTHDAEFATVELQGYNNTGSCVVHLPSFDFYYTEYIVKVQAINEIGPGPISHEVVIFSAEDMPQVAPQGVAALSYNSTALNVTWNPINQTRENVRGKLIGHRIKYWRKSDKEENSVYYLSRTTRPWTLIVGLIPDTYYFVKVMAYNSAGEGPESERYIERTYRKAPQKPPSSVRVYGINPSTIRVTWRYVQPTRDEENLLGFKIRIWDIDQDMSTANDTIATGDEKIISNLTPGKKYVLRVLAYSFGGDGRMSSPALKFQMGDENDFKSNAQKPAAARLSLFILSVSLAFIASKLTH